LVEDDTEAKPSAAFLNPSYQALPGFLSSTKFADPTDPNNTAVQQAFDAKGQSLLEILMARPENARGFGTLMNTWGEGNSLIQDLYPIKESLAPGFDPESVMFVDVGGGYGQKATALKRAVPDLPGRFVVQDLPGTVQNAPKTEGIEYQAHDFFTEQPVKGARAYYIRQCLHNWPREKCVTILSNLAKAMKPGYSKLFVHELIVPQRRAGTWMVTQDFNMMTLCGTNERTEAQWRELLAEAGLKVSGVYYPDDGVSEGVVEAEL
jgi:demethylsterigmatocystin 6-O-methyltransferase